MAAAYYFAAHFNILPAEKPTQPSVLDVPSTTATQQTLPPKNESLIYHATTPQRIRRRGYLDQQSTSPFFRLPAELRNQIYADLLCPSTPTPKALSDPTFHFTKQEALHPAILSTCRRIHEEAEDLLYTTNIFHAHPSLLTSLPHLTSPANPVVDPSSIAKISRWQLTLRLDTDPRFTMPQATAAFSGAEYLEIKVWQSMFDGCDSSVLRLFSGIRGVKIARVVGSADPQFARWLEGRMMAEVEMEEQSRWCRCGEQRREVRCGSCYKVVEGGQEWFGTRDAWTYGNR